jgi:predicted nucleotidyltransferase
MKSLSVLKDEQKAEVENLRAAAVRLVRASLQPQESITGVLLAGSVARGDARSGPYGVYVDIAIVAEGRNDVDLKGLFGPSIEPGVPKHCVKVEGIAVAFELTTTKDLADIRMKPEAEIYARQESFILYDRTGFLQRWKDTSFTITDEQRSNRALHWFFRYFYLVNNYRIEKWKQRSAWRVRTISWTGLRGQALSVLSRAQTAKGQFDALLVIPVDVLVDHPDELLHAGGVPSPVVEHLVLEAAEEAFACGVVRRARLFRHGPSQAGLVHS